MVNNIKTKSLTRQERLNIKRGGNITQDPFQTNTKRLDSRQRESLRQNRVNVDKIAKDNDNQFNNNNFGGSLSNFTKQYNSIDPVIRNRMKVNPTFVKNEINNRINKVDDRIKQVRKQIKNSSGDRKKSFKAELDALSEGKNQLSKGDLITVSQIRKFATDARSQISKQSKLKGFNTKLNVSTVRDTRLYASRVPMGGGSKQYLVNGKWVDQKPKTRELPKAQEKKVAFSNDTALISITDTKTNIKTDTRVRLRDGEILSTKKTPIFAKVKLPQFESETIENINNKVLTGQTVTPKEKARYLTNINEQNKKLTKQQVSTVVKFVSSPVNYGRNLVIRNQQGEKNPLFNDFKEFSRGVGQGLKEIFVDPVVDSFNYGRNLVKRAEKGNTAAIKILNKDIKKLTKTIKNGSTFVKNNPIQAGLIVGAAVGQGFQATKAAYKENPANTLGLAVAFLFPGTIIKGTVKAGAVGVKGIKTGVQLTRFKKLENKLKLLSKGNLTKAQTKKVQRALVRASKKKKVAQQNTILRTALKPILVSRGFKVKRGASIDSIVKQIAGSKDVIKVISKKTVPKKISKSKLKKGQIRATIVKPKPVKIPKKRAKKIIVKGTKAKKATAKEFKESLPKKKAGRPTKIKKIDVKAESERILKERLKKEGVVKQGDTTFIDLNAVERIEKASKPVKVTTRVSLRNNKSGSLKFRRQARQQIQVFEQLVKPKKVPKKIPKKKIVKVKKDIIKLKSILRGANLAGTATLISKLNAVSQDINKLSSQIPKQTPMPIKDLKKGTLSGQKPKQTPKSATATKPRGKLVSKGKVVLRKPVLNKPKKVPRKPRRLRLPEFNSIVKSKAKVSHNLFFKENGKDKVLQIRLPKNKAIKRAESLIKDKKLKRVEIVAIGSTTQTDIKRPSLARGLTLDNKKIVSVLKKR